MRAARGFSYRQVSSLSTDGVRQLAAVMATDGEEARFDEFVAWLGEEFAGLDHERRFYTVAEDRGRIIGFVRLWHSPHIDEWVIDGIVVAPSHRRRGIGRALLGEALALARRRSAPSVVAHIGHHNAPSVALHQQAGFRPETSDYLNSLGQPRSGIGSQYRLDL